MLRLQRRLGIKNVNAVDARLTVYVLSRAQQARHGFVASGKHGHAALRDIAHHAGIALRQIERNVAANGRYSQYIYFFRRGKREQQGDGIVLPRVAVNDDLSRHGLRTSA